MEVRRTRISEVFARAIIGGCLVFDMFHLVIKSEHQIIVLYTDFAELILIHLFTKGYHLKVFLIQFSR